MTQANSFATPDPTRFTTTGALCLAAFARRRVPTAFGVGVDGSVAVPASADLPASAVVLPAAAIGRAAGVGGLIAPVTADSCSKS